MGRKIVAELPLVIGVLADLAGDHPAVPRRPLKECAFTQVDREGLTDFFRSIAPGLNFDVPNRVGAIGGATTGVGTLAVAIRFHDVDDFTPIGIARQVPALEPLLREREALAGARPGPVPDPSGPLSGPDQACAAVRIANLDRVISAQVAEVIVHPSFQRLEAAWRGLHYLVTQSETSSMLKIKVLDVAKQELAEDLARAVDFEASRIFQKVYDDVYGRFRGEPFALLVGDYEFSHLSDDIDLLGKIANVAAAAFAPFIAAASPKLIGIEHWGDIGKPRDLAQVLAADAYARWRSFRDSQDASFVALSMPRVLARPAYGLAGDVEGHPATAPACPAGPQVAPGFRFDASVLSPGQDTTLWIAPRGCTPSGSLTRLPGTAIFPGHVASREGASSRNGPRWHLVAVRSQRPAAGRSLGTHMSRSPSLTDEFSSYPGSGYWRWPLFTGPEPQSSSTTPLAQA